MPGAGCFVYELLGYIIIFSKNFFYKNMRLENVQNLKTCLEHTEAEERRRTLILDTTQDRGIIGISVNVHLFNITFSVVRVEVCYKSRFVYY